MCVPAQQPLVSTRQALATLHGALAYLATADATALTTAEQADCLRSLERCESVRTAAHATVLAAFSSGCGYEDDGHGSARSWLRWQTRVTGAAAAAEIAWTRRLAAHPAVADVLAAAGISASWARQICDWTDLLPPVARPDAEPHPPARDLGHRGRRDRGHAGVPGDRVGHGGAQRQPRRGAGGQREVSPAVTRVQRGVGQPERVIAEPVDLGDVSFEDLGNVDSLEADGGLHKSPFALVASGATRS